MQDRHLKMFTSFIVLCASTLFSNAFQNVNLGLNIEFQHLSYKNGLKSTPYYMCQDHLGYIWFGCAHGVCRYDGYEFKLFHARSDTATLRTKRNQGICEDPDSNIWIAERGNGLLKLNRRTGLYTHYVHDPHDSTTISTNDIGGFFLDSHGYLWLACIQETNVDWVVYLDRIDTRTGRVKRFRHDPNDPTTPPADRIHAFGISFANKLIIAEDGQSNVWISAYGAGVYRFNRDSDSFTRYQHDPHDSTSLSSDIVQSISVDNTGSVWISTLRGINHYDAQKHSFQRCNHNPDEMNSLATENCYYVFQQRSSQLWISHALGLDRFDLETGVFEHFRHDPSNPYSLSAASRHLPIYEDSFGRIWILFQGVNHGIDIYEPQTGLFHRYNSDLTNPVGLHVSGFYFYGMTRCGTMWIGSGDGTINRIYPNTNPFLNMTKDERSPNSLLSNSIRDLYAEHNKNIIWMATAEGLTKYNCRTETYRHFRHDPTNPNSLCSNDVNAVTKDEHDNVWISTNEGLDKLDGRGNFSHYKRPPQESEFLSKSRLRKILYDEMGYLWICTELSGLNCLDVKTGKIKLFIKDKSDSTSLDAERQIFCLYKDRTGDLWVGADRGLSKYNYETEKFTSIVKGFVILSLFEDGQGCFWAGTMSHGLVSIDRETRTWKRFNHDHPLGQCKIKHILQDSDGFLWIATSRGLVRYGPSDHSVRIIDGTNGLPGSEYLTTGIVMPDGQMIWGTIDKGLIVFNPKQISQNDLPPQVVISDIKISNKSLTISGDSPLKQDISLTSEMHLRHDQNDISFICAALHYLNPEKNQYAFWLENYDEDWYHSSTTRTATYTNLDPGRYVFHVKAANSDGVWNEQPRSLAIIIHPPWYATFWAYGIYMLIISAIIYALWSTQLRRIRLRDALKLQQVEAKRLQEIDHMKTQFLANISHEFRTPLTLILGPIDVLLKRLSKNDDITELSIMRRNALRLYRLVNQLLDLSKIEAGKMTLQT